jgi:hypothetical protein
MYPHSNRRRVAAPKPPDSRLPTAGKAQARSRLSNGRDVLPNVDGRSVVARRYRDIICAVASDQGGAEHLVKRAFNSLGASALFPSLPSRWKRALREVSRSIFRNIRCWSRRCCGSHSALLSSGVAELSRRRWASICRAGCRMIPSTSLREALSDSSVARPCDWWAIAGRHGVRC